MSTDIKITNLPSELIENILCDECLTVYDLCRAARSCQKIHSVAQSNELWRRKLRSRWPELLEKYPGGAQHWWQDVYRYRFKCQKKIQAMVRELSPLHFHSDEISKEEFCAFSALMVESEHSPMVVIDELLDIFRHSSSHQNLTMKYYAEKVLRHLQQMKLTREFTEFLEQPEENQPIEKGAILIAQWCQPTEDIAQAAIFNQLDAIATRVKERLKIHHPNHPICCAELSSSKALSESLWKPSECRTVLESLNHVFYKEMGFSGNSFNYYQNDNSYINKVLESRAGIPITLAIIYSAVARRLGVHCEPVNFPTHFLLKWKEHPMLPPDQEYTFIDVFSGGMFMSQNDCSTALQIPRSVLQNPEVFSAIGPRLVYERMARNLVHIGRQQGQMGDNLLCLRNGLELYLVISPDDVDKILLLARVHLHLNINLSDVMESLQNLPAADQTQVRLVGYMMSSAQDHLRQKTARKTEIKPKCRPPGSDITFSVGMIMKHKRYHYYCVIYGWDERCMASPEWIMQMGVHNLPKKDTQPFYNVLVTDGSNRYAAQENLELADQPREIIHPEVGKYFQEFRKTYYLPNAEEMTQYPEDLQRTRTEIEKLYSS